jgi:cellulose synthase/poly-beta-1,6-N-acetylglucosamine synthase-like glycosyltransferase
VKVIRRIKAGGKSGALNTGILIAHGEIIITCDADSLIARGALTKIVSRFQDPSVSAVAGNVKVLNRTNLVTKCQALEYIVNENIYRRVFDIFGVVPVVPGPLASFRKKTLKEIGFYDRDTLTEDFDVTVKLLKTQRVVQALSDANVYTEAPTTWKDFIKQRTRWNRGTFQTIIKHRNVFGNPRFGYLRNLTFQYIILSMIFVPFVSVVSLAVIAIALLTGYALQVLFVMAVFVLIQTTYSLLAIMMDDEDWKLIIYSPLFVVGFKEVRNFIKIKALFDILARREMKWGTLQRIGAAETKQTTKPTDSK